MIFEHIAFIMEDPIKVANWYAKNFKLKIISQMDHPPFRYLLQDKNSTVALEIYRPANLPLPDYRNQNTVQMHLAFRVENFQKSYDAFLKHGASPEGEVNHTEKGDILAMIRDPWGFPIQIVYRAKKIS